MLNLTPVKLRYLRIAPRKVRLVADLIRGKMVNEAQVILNFTVKRATHPLLKLLKQGVANAKDIFKTEQSDLYISEIKVDEGPKLKRWRARARGRAFEIKKRTSHITLALSAIDEKKEKKGKKKLALIKTTTSKKEKEVEKEIKIKDSDRIRTDRKEVFRSKMKIEKTEKGAKKMFRRKAF